MCLLSFQSLEVAQVPLGLGCGKVDEAISALIIGALVFAPLDGGPPCDHLGVVHLGVEDGLGGGRKGATENGIVCRDHRHQREPPTTLKAGASGMYGQE